MTDLAPATSTRVPGGPDNPLPAIGPVLVVMHEDDAGPGRLTAGLPQLDVRRPYAGEPLPADLRAHAGLLVLGGSMGAWDDAAAPWLPATRRLLAEGVERQLPTLGICLGGQLLAAATGGQVERGEVGLEVGLVAILPLPEAADDALLAGIVADAGPGAAVGVPQWHQDAVTALPPGAVLLAASDQYPHQAFRLVERAWGLQYHPEVTAADFAEWMRGGHGAVRDHGLDPEQVLAELAAADAPLDRLARRHAGAFAALVAAGG